LRKGEVVACGFRSAQRFEPAVLALLTKGRGAVFVRQGSDYDEIAGIT